MAVREEVGLIALHEIKKNIRSLKGIVMFVLFTLGGMVPTVGQIVLDNMRRSAGMKEVSPDLKHELFHRALLASYKGDSAIADYLANCPPVLYVLFQGTLAFLPLLIILVGFDQIAGDVQYRSIRYVVGRVHREAIVIGKALGIWAVISVMTLVLHAVVWIAMLTQHDYGAADTLSWGLRLWVFSICFGGAYVGLLNLVSSWFKQPMLALLTAIGVGFCMFLARVILEAVGADPSRAGALYAAWIFPGHYEVLLVSPDPLRAIGGCALAIAWGGLLVAATTFILKRKDL
jgi:hypothetical protein